MPFSSVLGANSVVKPGVCTSATRPTVPYEGQLIYETDTDRVASYNGSAWVYLTGTSFVEWTAYTPSNTNVTVGNGTQTARYAKIGKTVFVSYRLVWGSTTSFVGSPTIGLPSTTNSFVMAPALLTDSGTSNFYGSIDALSGSTGVSPRSTTVSGSTVRHDSFVNATTPFTWTTNDVLAFSLTYEEQ